MRFFLIYMWVSMVVLSLNLVSSNGSIGITYDTEKKILKDVDLGLVPSEIDIDSIELGFIIDGKIYELKKYDIDLKPMFGTNILIIESEIDEKYVYRGRIYASMESKDRIVIEGKLQGLDGTKVEAARMYYYLKPREEYKLITNFDRYYSYDGFYIKSAYYNMNLYLANDLSLEENKIFEFTGETEKTEEKALLFVSAPIGSKKKDIFALSWNNFNFALNMTSFEKELKYWESYLEDYKNTELERALAVLKSYQRRDGSIYNFNKKEKIILVRDILSGIRSFIELGYFDDAKRGLRYIINSAKEIKGTDYLVSNYAYDFDRQEIFNKDEYGTMLNLINSAEFLSIFIDYCEESRDENFLEENIELVESKVGTYLLNFVDNEGVMENSGNNRIGMANSKRFFETQTAVYKSFFDFSEFLYKMGRDGTPYLENLNKIKNNIGSYIRKEGILSYPQGMDEAEENIYSLHWDYFDDRDQCRNFINKELLKINRYKDRDILEQIRFINFLYDFGYEEKASDMRKSLLGKMSRSNTYALYEIQNSVEFISEYISLLKRR